MPIYKEGRSNFDFRIILGAILDAEGNKVNDSPLPTGWRLEVESTDPDYFEVTQDAEDPKLVHARVGTIFLDGTSTKAIVKASLYDERDRLVTFAVAPIVVMKNPPEAITPMAIKLPFA